MPNEITPEAAIIELNRIRTDKGERPPEIDMAIKSPEKCYTERLQNKKKWRQSSEGFGILAAVCGGRK